MIPQPYTCVCNGMGSGKLRLRGLTGFRGSAGSSCQPLTPITGASASCCQKQLELTSCKCKKTPSQRDPCQGTVEQCGTMVLGQELLQTGQAILGEKDGDRREEDGEGTQHLHLGGSTGYFTLHVRIKVSS